MSIQKVLSWVKGHLPEILLVGYGLVFFLLGVWAVFDPRGFAAHIDILNLSETAVVDLGATYGFGFLGITIILCYFALRRDRQRFGVIVAAVISGTLGVGRLVFVVQSTAPIWDVEYSAMAIELVGAILAGILYRRMRREAKASGAGT